MFIVQILDSVYFELYIILYNCQRKKLMIYYYYVLMYYDFNIMNVCLCASIPWSLLTNVIFVMTEIWIADLIIVCFGYTFYYALLQLITLLFLFVQIISHDYEFLCLRNKFPAIIILLWLYARTNRSTIHSKHSS